MLFCFARAWFAGNTATKGRKDGGDIQAISRITVPPNARVQRAISQTRDNTTSERLAQMKVDARVGLVVSGKDSGRLFQTFSRPL